MLGFGLAFYFCINSFIAGLAAPEVTNRRGWYWLVILFLFATLLVIHDLVTRLLKFIDYHLQIKTCFYLVFTKKLDKINKEQLELINKKTENYNKKSIRGWIWLNILKIINKRNKFGING